MRKVDIAEFTKTIVGSTVEAADPVPWDHMLGMDIRFSNGAQFRMLQGTTSPKSDENVVMIGLFLLDPPATNVSVNPIPHLSPFSMPVNPPSANDVMQKLAAERNWQNDNRKPPTLGMFGRELATMHTEEGEERDE